MTRYAAFLYSVVLPGARLRSGPLIQFAQDCDLTAPIAVGSTGNLVFEADDVCAKTLAARLEARFADQFGKAVPILVRAAHELAVVAASHPFDQKTDTNNIAVRFQRSNDDAEWTKELGARTGNVHWHQTRNDLWLNFPNGVGPSKVASWIGRNGPIGTFRTYRSIQRVWAHCQ